MLILFFCHKNSMAQRKPTPQEAAVISKAANAVDDVIGRFVNSDWKMSAGGPLSPEYYSVAIKPNVPISTASFEGDWDFTIRTNSVLYNRAIQPYIQKISSPPTDPNDKQAWEDYMHSTDKIKGLQHIYVEACVNYLSLPVKPDKRSITDLKIPGCYFAFRQSPDHIVVGTDYHLPGYVLLFGDWSKARHSDGEYLFHFIHPPGTPYIENIVIILSGNEDRIKELLKKMDWTKINEGLSL